MELFVLRWTGSIIIVLGFCGAVIAMMIDEIRGFVPQVGWFQMTAIAIFLVVMLFGVFVSKFLNDVKEMIEKYLNV